MTEGLLALRERLAALSAEKGILTGPERILATSGSQQAIDIITRCLVAPGDAVLVERPTFITALQTFRVAQAHLIGIDSDAEGSARGDHGGGQALRGRGPAPEARLSGSDLLEPPAA